jgi:xanthine dehydrogenase accessory factor
MWAVAEDVVRWSGEGKLPAVARVVAFTGFGGRRAGEVLAMAPGGDRAGALLGGSADEEVLAAALHLGLEGGPQAEVLEVAVGDREAVDAGLACGGLARVLVQDAGSLPDRFWERLVERRPVALATVVRRGAREGAPAVGSAMVIVPAPRTAGETARSTAGDGAAGDPGPHPRFGDVDLEELAVATATELLARPGEPVRLVAHEAGDLVVEAFVPPCRLVVVGDRSALADAIGRQAELLDWHCDVVPDLGGSLDAVSRLGPGDAVVVLSHDPDFDTPVLAAAVAGDAYVGALGSRHTQAARRGRLATLGIGAAQIERVHGPVGLDLGARVPEETALAICAEILATRNGRNAASLRAGDGPING